MPSKNDALRKSLSRSREIKIGVTGRKSGRKISNPVWFVLEGENLYLLPVEGSDTQWYKNVLENPFIQVETSSQKAQLEAVPLIDAAQVSSVVEKFREKYGSKNVKKYYSKLDVAVLVKI